MCPLAGTNQHHKSQTAYPVYKSSQLIPTFQIFFKDAQLELGKLADDNQNDEVQKSTDIGDHLSSYVVCSENGNIVTFLIKLHLYNMI